MKEEFVSYQQAKQLKELGFEGNGLRNHIRQAYYLFPDGRISSIKHDGDAILVEFERDGPERIPAPRLDQAQKWLRDVKGIAINVIAHDGGEYHWSEVYLPNFKEEGYRWYDYREHPLMPTYEEALSAGLDAILTLLTEPQ